MGDLCIGGAYAVGPEPFNSAVAGMPGGRNAAMDEPQSVGR